MTDQLRRTGTNNLGAFYSFLRVLATNVATALLPLFLAGGQDELEQQYPTGKAITIAVVASVLLTVTNYFRTGETRFGRTTPNVVRDDAGRGELGLIGLILAVAGAIVLLLVLLKVIALSVEIAVLALVLGVVLVLVDRRSA